MKLLKKSLVFALSAFLLLGSVACASQDGEDGKEYTDPNTTYTTYDNRAYNEYLLGEEATIANQWEGYGIGDPFVMRWNGMYYLYCSSLNFQTGIRGYKSADLVNWTPMTGNGLTEGYVSQDPITASAYAPEVYYWDGTFYMYTSPGGYGHYVLTSASPEGPFVKATENFGLRIDGSVFIDDNEEKYFLYADDTGIRMAKMTDMLTVDATATPVLNGTSIGGWTEGPYVLKRDGIYYLTYTGNHVTSDGYRIAYATAENLSRTDGGIDRNAFTRAADNPLALETEGELKGIGHSSTVMGPDMDSYYLAYHYLNSSGGPNRSLGIDRLTFNGKQMSVSPGLQGSVKPALPAFYATGKDGEKFETSGAFLVSKESAAANFTAEFNVSGSTATTFVFAYTDENNYAGVTIDLAAKSISLFTVQGGQRSEIAQGKTENAFSADKMHAVRVAARDGLVDVVFDEMTKIDDASATFSAGKIGYKDLATDAQVGYTAFSNVAMGMSDESEPKQATGYVGASLYLREDTYCDAFSLSDKSGVAVIEEGNLAGVKSMTLAKEDFVSYLVNAREGGRYAIELIYRESDGGKEVGIRIGNETAFKCKLPAIEAEEGEYVKAVVMEADLQKGANIVKIESLSEEIAFAGLRFVEASAQSPQFEASLGEYVEKGVDYKTIWKIKDGGHYAKAGTRQLVYFGDNTIGDFTMEVEIKLEGATGTSTAGIVFHAQNYAASSYDAYTSIQGYYLAVNNNQVVLDELNYADGSQSNLATFVQGNPFKTSDVFVPLKIQVRGNTITAWSGETLLFTYTDTWGFSNGKIGLYTNGAAVIYRNLKIYA